VIAALRGNRKSLRNLRFLAATSLALTAAASPGELGAGHSRWARRAQRFLACRWVLRAARLLFARGLFYRRCPTRWRANKSSMGTTGTHRSGCCRWISEEAASRLPIGWMWQGPASAPSASEKGRPPNICTRSRFGWLAVISGLDVCGLFHGPEGTGEGFIGRQVPSARRRDAAGMRKGSGSRPKARGSSSDR